MNLTDLDFTTPNNAALSLKTLAEYVRRNEMWCKATHTSDGVMTLRFEAVGVDSSQSSDDDMIRNHGVNAE